MTLRIKDVHLFEGEQLVKRDVCIKDGKIVSVRSQLEGEEGRVLNGEGKFLSPGFIDIHVHLREPGGEEKETIASGTAAALRGGFTTVCAMPNTRPVPDSVESLTLVNEKITHSAHVNVHPYASITTRQLGQERTNFEALQKLGAVAFTDDGVGVQNADVMLEAMKAASKIGATIVAHCEENTLIHSGVMHEGVRSQLLNLPGIPSVCESTQIARDVLLAEQAGCHYHVCHVSTKESVRVIRDAKRAGINVTAEVTPHHLLLDEHDIHEDHGFFKMNPPLRSEADRFSLLQGLIDGTIDCIATDHAPHTEEEKNGTMLHAPFGIVGLETAFSLLYTHLVQPGTITLKQLLDWLTVKPAQIFSLREPCIREGAVADLVLLDLETTHTINRHEFVSKGKNTPFHGWQVVGTPVATIVNGALLWNKEEMKYETKS
ncbi:dihydroorotase [Pontibacillus halophilus JSM 076056 = DSM 19796]|uniref:Dihydroorotase n=2 Tax=Pontibacillus TaxID=289201 RepID=A0A0A5GPQ9_9BACI|nr:dihydroorotase [Pontibacillus halophilus JSM 076056 = DSM 19796]